MKRQANEQPDWSVVKQIHSIHERGGKLDEANITITKDRIRITRYYILPSKSGVRPSGRIIMENDYPSADDLTCISDMFMLEVGK